MADEDDVVINGKPISTMRVVDLKNECDKRGLNKNGSKTQLVDRLTSHVLQGNTHVDSGRGDGTELKDDASQNEFIRQYMKQQKQLIENAESSLNSSSQESDIESSPQKLQSSSDKHSGSQSHLDVIAKLQKQANTNKGTPDNTKKSKITDSEKSAKSEPSNHDQEKGMTRGRRHASSEQTDKTDSHHIQNLSSKSKDLDKEEREIEGKSAKKVTTESKENAKAKEVKELKGEQIDQRNEKRRAADVVDKEKAAKNLRPGSRSRSRSPKNHRKKTPQQVQSSLKRKSSSSLSSRSSRSRSGSKEMSRRTRHGSSSGSSSRSRSPSLEQKKPLLSLPRNKKSERSSSSSSSRSRSPTPKFTNRPAGDAILEAKNQPKSKSPESQTEKNPSSIEVKGTQADGKTATEKESIDKSMPEMINDKKEDKETVAIVKVSETKDGSDVHELLLSQSSEVKAARKISLIRNTIDESGDGEKAEGAESKITGAGEKPAKKRKWGSRSATLISQKPKKASSIPISTESLKNLIPDIKPSLKMAPEPIMDDEMDYEDDTASTEQQQQPIEQEDTRSVKIQRTIKQVVKEPEDTNESGSNSEAEKEQETPAEIKQELVEDNERMETSEDSGNDDDDGTGDNGDGETKEDQRKVTEEVKIEKQSNEDVVTKSTKSLTVMTKSAKPKVKKDRNKEIKVIRRLDSGAAALIQPDEPQKPDRSPSPPRYPPSKIVHIRNLVRPFTINQLKELLRRHGNFDDNEFWIDKIKSHCFATFETEDQALATRRALHNTRWPISNPKTLIVDFGSEEQMEYYRGDEKPIPPPEKKPKIIKEKEVQENKEEERLKQLKDEKEKEIERRRKEREKRMKEREEKERNEKPRPVREWDKDKKSREDWDRTLQKSKSRSPKKQRSRSVSRERRKEDRSGDRSRERQDRRQKKKETKDDEPPAKLLDDLFRKTTTTPCIYWLPLTEVQIAEKKKLNLVKPVLRQKQEGDRVSPMRDIPEAERKRRSSSPVANARAARETRSPVRPRQRRSSPEPRRSSPEQRRSSPEPRRSPPEHRRKESSPDPRNRSSKKR